jgi:molybdopterin synthase sulfur carrier subunit
MVTLNIAGFLTDFTEGRSQIPLADQCATVGECLARLWQLHVGLRDRVINEKGEVRLHVNVFVNNESIKRLQGLSTPLGDGDEITILPSVSGG